MCKVLAALIFVSELGWGFQNRIDDGAGWANITAPLRRAGIPLDDQAALIRTLHRRDRPILAASAADALQMLPKNDLVVRELHEAGLADDENLMSAAISTLAGFGDTQWVAAARARLPGIRNKFIRLEIAGRLARAGVYDGWDLIESTIMTQPFVYRDIALVDVYFFRDRKDASGQPIDLVQKLEEMRSRASSQAVRDALTARIAGIKYYQEQRPALPAEKK